MSDNPDINDDRLLEDDDYIQPGQIDPALREREKEAAKSNTSTENKKRLTQDNWHKVKRLTNQSREIINLRQRIKHLHRRSQLQVEQTIRPNWLMCRQNPPLLPGSVAFPQDFHEEWTNTIAKHERKLIKKVTKHLPTIITGIDIRLEEHRRSAQDTIRREIKDGEQMERALGLFLNITNKAEQEAPLFKPPRHLTNRRN